MTALPPHVGRVVEEETGYALVCGYTRRRAGELCMEPARWHIRWEAATGENGLACDGHLAEARRHHPFQVHSVDDSACGMPGSGWQVEEPSRCVLLTCDPDLLRAGHVHLEAVR